MKSNRGAALIMALYVTIIVFSLATFFIADQLHKSRIVVDSKDGKLALEGANLGIAYVVNYLGDLNNHWANSVEISDGAGNKVCGGATVNFQGNQLALDVLAGQFGVASGSATNANLFKNGYQFSIVNPILVSPREKKYARITGTLTVLYNNPLVAGATCQAMTANSPDALSGVSLDIVSQVTDSTGGVVYASREVQWSGKRILNLAEFYQCWTCWDEPGGKYPNGSEGTSRNNYLGNGFVANAGLAGFSRTCLNCDQSTSPDQSPYGSSQDGIINMRYVNASGFPGEPQANAAVLAYGAINNTNGILDGKQSANTNYSTPIPTGSAFGGVGSGQQNTAQLMSQAFATAATDGACANGSGIKTVFVDSSQNVALTGWGGTTQGGAGIEYNDNSADGHQKPGFAVIDVNLNDPNHPGQITVTQSGYYSGKILFQETFSPSALAKGTIYIAGNARVHGNVAPGQPNVTVVVNQGETFYSSAGTPLAPNTLLTAPDGAQVRLNDRSCVAPNTLNNQTYDITTAQRYQSNVGGPSSTGVNYWIAGTNIASGCTNSPAACTAYPQSNSPSCTSCLHDGVYYDASGTEVGVHVDDLNGGVNSVPPSSLSWNGSGYWQVSCASSDSGCLSSFNNSIYAPPPQYNPDGTIQSNTSLMTGASVELVVDGVNTSSKILWPYPGSDNAVNYQQTAGAGKDVFQTRQFEYSEGNGTIAGDTAGAGLFAQNFVLVNDMTASAKQGQGDTNTNVIASIASANHSIQWEGMTNLSDPIYPNDVFMNGDNVALKGQYANGAAYTHSYTLPNGTQGTATARSWEGGPEPCPSPCPISGFTSPFIPSGSRNATNWNYNFTGVAFAPYQDAMNFTLGNGKLSGYAIERIGYNRYSSGAPPSFPNWTFLQWQAMSLTALYPTTSYQDKGAPHS